MIGGLYAGDPDHLGSDNNVVEKCVFSDVWHAVYIWHSSGNKIIDNNVATLTTNHWAAISTYDGYNDAQIGLGHPSENNVIVHNTLANKGIALGAWAPPTWTSNAGSKVCCNTATSVGVTYSHGPVIVGCNSGGFWHSNTDKVLRVTGVTYAGDTELWTTSDVTVNLKAQLSYDGSADGSGVEVDFTVNGAPYSATTSAGGLAGTTAILGPGTYTVETKVTVCPSCELTDSDPLVVHGFRGIKELVLQDLESLRASVTDKQDGNKLDQAIDHLSKSLAPELWLSETRLDPKRGDKVFQEEKDAVVKLLELMKDKKSTLYGSPKLQDFINRLVNIDRLLASTAINDAAGGDVKKIDKANDELGKGDAGVADSHFTDAIEHYRNAWKHALQAV
jgi:parallel beta-helix repeat protein